MGIMTKIYHNTIMDKGPEGAGDLIIIRAAGVPEVIIDLAAPSLDQQAQVWALPGCHCQLRPDDTCKEIQTVHICKPSSEPLWQAEVLLQYQPLLKADCAWLD